ncbi:hypothetical protein HJC23_007429 [Cyclotella cryptica]|uniref:C2 NT-type domain-containing protein n=1 Tax=Cyclotella cryptica TaxID=29204 RepID=A0ABD3QK89_9STRA|eukprot:CCRYP_005183-RA/>CCRYP_005183-RA protein AED:0.31 eAED:0.31 QI:0/-1/0/1/-1/1/1/0/761
MRNPTQRSTPKPPTLTSRQKKHHRTTPDASKLLHVSVTVISLSGVYFKESSDVKNSDDEALATNPSYPKTAIVASFSRIDGKEVATMDYHVRSLPLDLSTATTKEAYKEVIRWPTQVGDDNKDVSTFRFERHFLREKKGKGRKSRKKGVHLYAPQSCRIQLAVCRNGRWFKLGDADIMITGEERGEESVSAPLINQDRPKTKKSKSNVIPMARLKGETLACGLGPNAALRVLVNVSEHPYDEKTIDPTLATVVSWEYDPVRAAIVEKSDKGKSPVKVNGQAVTTEVAAEQCTSETTLDQEEKNAENHETITSDVRGPHVTETTQTSQELSGKTEIADVPPVLRDSSLSKQDLPPIRQSSASSKPEDVLDRITIVAYEQSSPQSSASARAQAPIRGFSPIRVSSPMRTLSPFRALAPIRQRSGTTVVKKPSSGSVLDRVVTITSNAPPVTREGSLPQSNSSSPPHDGAAYDQNVFYIEHDMESIDEIPSPPPAIKEISRALSRSSITLSTAEQSRSHLSAQSGCSEFSPSGLTLARYRTGNSSTFAPSHNSSFTSASGYSMTRCSTDNTSMYSQASGDMSVVMAELLEKTPSELYAIIHDTNQNKAPRHKRKSMSQSIRLPSGKVASHVGDEEEYEEDCESEGDDSVEESTALHGRDDESSVSCSESSSSFVEFRHNGQSVRGNFFTDKARNFGRRLICSIPMCGIGARDDKTLSCVDESVTFLTGKGDILACQHHNSNDTWIGSASSSGGKSSIVGSDLLF